MGSCSFGVLGSQFGEVCRSGRGYWIDRREHVSARFSTRQIFDGRHARTAWRASRWCFGWFGWFGWLGIGSSVPGGCTPRSRFLAMPRSVIDLYIYMRQSKGVEKRAVSLLCGGGVGICDVLVVLSEQVRLVRRLVGPQPRGMCVQGGVVVGLAEQRLDRPKNRARVVDC